MGRMTAAEEMKGNQRRGGKGQVQSGEEYGERHGYEMSDYEIRMGKLG